jgi:hypothetical protein
LGGFWKKPGWPVCQTGLTSFPCLCEAKSNRSGLTGFRNRPDWLGLSAAVSCVFWLCVFCGCWLGFAPRSSTTPVAAWTWQEKLVDVHEWNRVYRPNSWIEFLSAPIHSPLSSSSLRSLTSHGLEVGRSHLEGWPHLPTAIPAQTDASNRPSTASGARIRSIQVKRQWIIGPATPLGPAAPMKMGPHAQPTSLTYKRSLTLAVSNTQRRSISLPLFCSLRVGLV